MSHDTLATLLWLMLGLSVALAFVGVAARASWLLFLAAALSFMFGIAAIFSIGIVVIALAFGQLVLGIAIRKSDIRESPR